MEKKEHHQIQKLKQQYSDKKINRREFLRTSTLLGLSAAAAYSFVGQLAGKAFASSAGTAMPKGGTLKIAMQVQQISNPHAIRNQQQSNIIRAVYDYLSRTGADNVTRPSLLESWMPSDDLKTWVFKVRKGVKWHNGRAFTADDVMWNFERVLDPKEGSSILGLFKPYLFNEKDDQLELWKADALKKVDDFTIQLSLKKPLLAVPEYLFHYPFAIIDPEEKGTFDVGTNGTGPFKLTEYVVQEKAVFKANSEYWGEGPYVDNLKYFDYGDDESALVSALATNEVDGVFQVSPLALGTVKKMSHVTIYDKVSGLTSVARGKCDQKPFSDPRVRKALRLSIDTEQVAKLASGGLGEAGEHHHVSPVHPEYAKLPMFNRDVSKAKKLLSEAGYPKGLDLKMTVSNLNKWEVSAAQLMVPQWKEAGIRIKLDLVPDAQWIETWEKVPFGMTRWGHRPLGVMALDLGYASTSPWNESAYSNPEFDKLLTQAQGTYNVEERRKIMAEIEKILQEDGPITQPLWISIAIAYSKKVKGVQAHPSLYIFPEIMAMGA